LSSSLDAGTIRQVPYIRLRRASDARDRPCDDGDLRLLDDAIGTAMPDNGNVESDKPDCAMSRTPLPAEASSSDPDVLRAALIREHDTRRRAECLAAMQSEVVQLAVDLLVREPDIEGFFGGLTKVMVEDTDSHACAVWLLEDEQTRCSLWMAYADDRLYTRGRGEFEPLAVPYDAFGRHLMAYKPGWSDTIEYEEDDERLPEMVRELQRRKGVKRVVVTPLVVGATNLGWIKLACTTLPDCADAQWWRVV